MRNAFWYVILLAWVGACGEVLAGPAWIRLVDPRGVPLEYWEQTVAQPELGSSRAVRLPRTVTVDGQPWEFDKYGKASAELLTHEAEKDREGLAEFDQELGAAAPGERTLKSDRTAELQSGSGRKGQVHGELGEGAHVVQPGDVHFTVAQGKLAAPVAGLTQAGPTGWRLVCLPVELGVVPPPKSFAALEISCSSGTQEVFRESFPAGTPLALRLYLPASATGYTLTCGALGEWQFTLDDQGVHLRGTPTLATGLGLNADRMAFTLASPATTLGTPPAPAITAPALYLFTDRQRRVYNEGEMVQLSVRAQGAAADGDQVTLVLAQEGAPALTLAAHPLLRQGEAAAAELELDTHALRPGAYQVHAQWGAVASNVITVELASLLPATNLQLFGFSKWLKPSYQEKDLLPLARAGLNMIVQDGGAWGQMSPFPAWHRLPAAAAAPKRGSPATAKLALPELQEPPLERDHALEYLLAHGISYVPTACGLILYFNVGDTWQNVPDDRNQGVQHLAQSARRFPNFRGIVHCTGDGPTPATLGMVWAAGASSFDIIHDQRLKKLREVFDAKVGKLQVDDAAAKAEFERINSQMQGATGFGVGMDAGLNITGDDATKLAWARWLNDLYPACFRGERQALDALMPRPLLACSHTWGPGAASGMWEETFYQEHDHPLVDIHGDYGVMPMSYSSGSDVLCMGSARRPWIVLDLLPERTFANGLKIFLEAFSRNPAGIGAMNEGLAGGWSLHKDPSERFTVLLDLARRFGDTMQTLQRRDEIAILASFRQDALAKQSEAAIWGAHFLATKAGYQANVVTEEQCLRAPDTLKGYRAVMLPQFTRPLPAPLLAQLTAFQTAGGVVLADAASTAAPAGAVTVPSADMLFANQVDFRAAYNRFEPLIAPFRAAVEGKAAPFFSSSARHVHLVRSSDGDVEYWTLFNDTLQTPADSPNGHFIQFLYKGVETDLQARRQGVLYDAFRRTLVPTTATADGMQWHADLRQLPGTLYLCTDRPVAKLAVTADAQASRSGLLHLQAAAQDAQGKAFTGRLPLEVVLTDPAGHERYRVYRTTNLALQFKLAANDPAGTWQWTATEQATSLTATGQCTVAGDAPTPAVRALTDLVYDADAVGKALHEREFDIVLYPEQLALQESAATLAAALQQAGAKARVRVLGPAQQRVYLMNWSVETIEDEELQQAITSGQAVGLRQPGKNQHGTRHSDPMKDAFYGQYTASAERVLYRDVILLGRGDVAGNPLLDIIIQRAQMLPRNPSPSFPAPGFGLVAYAWAPFHYGHDAIVVYGRDAAGLARATASLLALAKAPPAARPAPAWPLPHEAGQSYGAAPLIAAIVRPPAAPTVTSSTRVATSLLPPVADERVLSAVAEGGRLVLQTEPVGSGNGPVAATVDLASGAAQRFTSAEPGYRRAPAEVLARSSATQVASPLIRAVPGGRLMPLGRGLALVDDAGAVKWFTDPFPTAHSLLEAQYPRLCHALAVSADGRIAAAAFYDLGSGADYGPKYRSFNAAAVVLLDTATGAEVGRLPGYVGDLVQLSADGSRCAVVDYTGRFEGREVENPHGGFTAAITDRSGKELLTIPAEAATGLALSASGTLAVVSYNDPRRYVSVLDVAQRQEHQVSYPRIDVGLAAAPDGSFAVITYADGLVRAVAPSGKVLWEQHLPAAGVPVVLADGRVTVAANDGQVYFPSAAAISAAPPLSFAAAPVATITPVPVAAPPGLAVPTTPWWTTLAGEFSAAPLPGAALADLPDLTTAQTVTVELPKLAGLDLLLLTCQYQLKDPAAMLQVALPVAAGDTLQFRFPYFALPHTAVVPLRLPPGARTLTFSAPGGGTVTHLELRRVHLAGCGNAALAGAQRQGANVNTPALQVPNIHGALGDPRVEQMGFGWPAGHKSPLPELKDPVKADVFSVFDSNVYHATPLYPTVYPGKAPWDPVEALATMRCAQVVMEFAQPRSIAALGVWEQAPGLPVADFALEYCTQAVESKTTHELTGNWQIAATGRANTDYYHLRQFAKPIAARYWRYSLLATPCAVQRIAEIELYEAAMDTMEQDLDAPKAGVGGDLPGL